MPACEADRLDEINDLIGSCLPYPIKREKLAIALETENYIKKLLQLFRRLEEDRQTRALHKLYDIFKNIFLLNKNPLFEVMLSEDALWDVIGVFEYDPSLPQAQTKKHRDYLRQVSKFKEVIPLGNSELIAKIHQTYRVQYIQDVVLPTPSVFEENMLSTLSSFIFFNKVCHPVVAAPLPCHHVTQPMSLTARALYRRSKSCHSYKKTKNFCANCSHSCPLRPPTSPNVET